MLQSDLDRSVGVTDAEARLYVGALRSDRAVLQAELPRDTLGVGFESPHQDLLPTVIHGWTEKAIIWAVERDPDRDVIPIFPLENVVLFPRVQVPLHIFEPRYRQMTEHALSSGRCIGMVTLQGGELSDPPIQPRVFDIGCTGSISRCEELPDGRYNVVLGGEKRFRILEELPSDGERLYRLARVEELVEVQPQGDAEREVVGRERVEVMQCMEFLLRDAAPDLAEEISSEFLDRFDDESFVNALCQAIDFAPPEKQGLLECDAVLDRISRLSSLLRFRLAEVHSGQPGFDAVH